MSTVFSTCLARAGPPGEKVVVIGAGIGGLTAALLLASRGMDVTVLESASAPGGKMRQQIVGDRPIDAGPTVFTLKPVFEEIFRRAGADFDSLVPTRKANILARHAWDQHQRLDLFADQAESADAIGRLAGAREAAGFKRFCGDAERIWRTLEFSFIRRSRPGLFTLTASARFSDLLAIRPFTTLWRALGDYFADTRLRQLFARYATYCGSSPFASPATLMLVSHVEQSGVWMIQGGMHRLAQALAELAEARGACFRYGAHVARIETSAGHVDGVTLSDGERITARRIIYNGDVAALGAGLLGSSVVRAVPAITADKRSLSALTWTMLARTNGFPLSHHSVFFSRNYRGEFEDIFTGGAPPREPTVYICAQDRWNEAAPPPEGAERLLCLINAPPRGDDAPLTHEETEACRSRAFETLQRCGLTISIQPEAIEATRPTDFAHLFPASGGSLYGAAAHGWMASFRRPGARTSLPGLYLAGGSAHPGPGVPMAALSGMAASDCLMADLTSRSQSRPTAMPGGISTRSALTAARD